MIGIVTLVGIFVLQETETGKEGEIAGAKLVVVVVVAVAAAAAAVVVVGAAVVAAVTVVVVVVVVKEGEEDIHRMEKENNKNEIRRKGRIRIGSEGRKLVNNRTTEQNTKKKDGEEKN